MSTPLLKLVAVHRSFASGVGGPSLSILRGVEVTIERGESVAIVGPSGSGKSTVLNLLGTLDRPDQGQVLFEGQDLTTLDERALAVFRNRSIGFVFQSHHLLPHCTVWENVLIPTLAEHRSAPPAAMERARHLLKRVGLADRLSHRPGQLSGGERQRAAVVRALVNEPSVLLADEPTGALDRVAAAELGKLLVELNLEEKITLVVVTHALDLARSMGRVLELRDGRLQGLVNA
jgi:lipoprotein-releasing system ATP-binding protein